MQVPGIEEPTQVPGIEVPAQVPGIQELNVSTWN